MALRAVSLNCTFFQISNFVAKKLQLVFIEKVHNIFVTDNFFLYIGIRNFFAWNAIKMVFVLSYRHILVLLKNHCQKVISQMWKKRGANLAKYIFFCQLIFFNSYIIFILIKKKITYLGFNHLLHWMRITVKTWNEVLHKTRCLKETHFIEGTSLLRV